ncbi:MAG: leucyl aminopeptidase [Gammaproteobacteria bacterium]|nr:leucyl aminopeptidase [Gammaproteobacteria bacterium]
MDLNAAVADIATQRTDCAVIPIFQGTRLSAPGQVADEAWGKRLSQVLRGGDISGKLGESLIIHTVGAAPAQRALLIGMGKAAELDDRRFRRAAAAAAGALAKLKCKSATSHLGAVAVKDRGLPWRVRCIAEAMLDAGYRFDQMKSKPEPCVSGPAKGVIAIDSRRELRAAQRAINEAKAVSAGRSLARDLGNLPGNVCTPSYLAEEARKLAGRSPKLKSRVLTESELGKLGMGSFLAVAQGSAEPPRLITIEYSGGDAERQPIVLVGKGVTFDSGGISIKPAGTMDEMKFDMCGAASVLGTLQALADLEALVNVVGIIAATENLPSGTAIKPGDIVTTMSGKTVEILNTDAEGRLILCDALTFAERFEPDVIIDIATLTGACMVALGQHPSGLFSNNDKLADALLRAGEDSGDRVWRLPIWEDYQESLNSNFADFANVGGRYGGAITAACFLARFATDYRWAHLDIAGTAWHSGTKKGATGRPVGLLTEFVLKHGAGRKRSRSKPARAT